MTLVGLIGAAPRARCGARRCVCAKHAVVCAVVLLDGGSSWSAPGRAALLEPPAAASAAAVRCPGNLLELWSKRDPANPRREGALLSRHATGAVTRREPAHKNILGMAARDRADGCRAARRVPGRSREEHHLLAC